MAGSDHEALTLFQQGPERVGAAPQRLARVRMVIAYHGASFHGFAANAGVRTVAGVLIEALERLLGHSVELAVAGRTDKGVHAWGNVVSFDAAADGLDPERLKQALNKMLRPHVAVREASLAPEGFDARFAALSRTYRYLVLNRDAPDPLLADRAWYIESRLDLGCLRLACDPLIGAHDFSSFCRRPKRSDGAPVDLTRRVRRASWTDLGGGLLQFEIEANAFCHQMVRSIVGTIVEAGMGVRRAGEVAAIIRARDRRAAGRLAPAHGLLLWSVSYP